MDWHAWAESLRANIWWIVSGIVGRMMFHGREAQAGRRRFWGKELPFELLVAIGMAFIGKALAGYFGLSAETATAVAGIAAYLGPRALDTAFAKVSRSS